MAIRLSERHMEAIRDHARRAYPHECCGVLIGDPGARSKRVSRLHPMPNVHEEGHERRYRIGPAEWAAIERGARAEGERLLGVYHSHPDHPARPSEYDREWAWPWYSYIIVAVERGEARDATCWTLRVDRSAFDAEAVVIEAADDRRAAEAAGQPREATHGR